VRFTSDHKNPFITIENDTGILLSHIFIRPYGISSWGMSQGSLANGGDREIQLSNISRNDRWDFRFVGANGDIFTILDREVTADQFLVVTRDYVQPTVTIHNTTGYPLDRVFLRGHGETHWTSLTVAIPNN
jgi:hypothetical protein